VHGFGWWWNTILVSIKWVQIEQNRTTNNNLIDEEEEDEEEE
jgi:hypothetical protein